MFETDPKDELLLYEQLFELNFVYEGKWHLYFKCVGYSQMCIGRGRLSVYPLWVKSEQAYPSSSWEGVCL